MGKKKKDHKESYVNLRLETAYFDAYNKQLSAQNMTMSKRIRDLIKKDITDLDLQIDLLKQHIADHQAQLADLIALQNERLINPIIPDKKRHELLAFIDNELEILDRGGEIWGPADYRKRIAIALKQTGATKAEILKTFKERAGIIMKDEKRRSYLDHVHKIIENEGDPK